MRKSIILLGIIIVSTMLFTACPDISQSSEIQTPIENGYGKISINIAEKETANPMIRTVLPSPVFDKYVYIFTKSGEETGLEKAHDEQGFFFLELGTYTVEVQAFIGSEDSYVLAASGVSEPFLVAHENNDPVEILLSEVEAEGQGTFSYTISYPEGASVEITLQKWPEMENMTLTPDLTEGECNETLELNTGSYLLTILARNAGLSAGLIESVHIHPAITTEYTKNFVFEDFHKSIGAVAETPTLNLVTDTSITINILDIPDNGQSIEYAISTVNSAPSSNWQTSTNFTGLIPSTTYYVFARTVGNNFYETGMASSSLLVTTRESISGNRFEYYWVNEHGSLVTTSGGTTTIWSGQTLTITAQDTSYTVKQWHLNGVNTEQVGNTYNFSSKATGRHVVGLFVEKDAKLYNTNIIIRVQ